MLGIILVLTALLLLSFLLCRWIIHLNHKEKLCLNIDNISEGIIVIDPTTAVHRFNKSCEKIFGYLAYEVIGKNIEILISNPGHAKTSGRRECEGKRKNGEIFWLDLSVSETVIDDQTLLILVVRDINKNKEIAKTRDDFISRVNHELRTPLTAIKGALDLISIKSESSLNPDAKKLFKRAYSNCERLENLVNEILYIEKIMYGKMDYKPEIFELQEAIKDIVESNQTYAGKYGVKIVITTDCPHNILLNADKNRFTQAFVNLLSNAAKFSPQGETVNITVSLAKDNKACIAVKDKGPGIPKYFRSKIFEKFAQSNSDQTKNKEGNGLGLYIAKSIVEALGGTISFDSIEGQGATFYIIIPVHKT